MNDKAVSPATKSQGTGQDTSSSATSSGSVQLKSALRGMDYDPRVAALSPVQAKAAGDSPVQMTGGSGAISWVDGIDIGKASTFDSGGGHSYKGHGAHTTRAQHKTRLDTGVAPSGRASRVPTSAPCPSKFDSDSQHEAVLKKAEDQLPSKSSGGRRERGINGRIGVIGAGTIYTRDDTEEAATDVHVVGDKFNLNTVFPTK